MLGDVRERLRDEEVGGGLGRRREPLVRDRVERHRDRRAVGERLAAPAPRPCSVSTAGWMPRASSRSSSSAARSSPSASASSSPAPFASGPSCARRAGARARARAAAAARRRGGRARAAAARRRPPRRSGRARRAARSSCARSSACSRSFSSASRAAAPAASSSAARSSSAGSWIERCERSVGRAEHRHGAAGARLRQLDTGGPLASTYAARSGSQSASSSDGSPSVRASASLNAPGGVRSSSTTRSATAARERAPPEQAGREREWDERAQRRSRSRTSPRASRSPPAAEDRELDDELRPPRTPRPGPAGGRRARCRGVDTRSLRASSARKRTASASSDAIECLAHAGHVVPRHVGERDRAAVDR